MTNFQNELLVIRHSSFVIRHFAPSASARRTYSPTGFHIARVSGGGCRDGGAVGRLAANVAARSGHQRSAERRAIALQAVQVVTEEVGNLPWDSLTTESAQQTQIPAPLGKFLPGARLAVNVVEEQMPVVSKRISVELTWTGTSGQAGAPARLTSWVFPDQQPPK